MAACASNNYHTFKTSEFLKMTMIMLSSLCAIQGVPKKSDTREIIPLL